MLETIFTRPAVLAPTLLAAAGCVVYWVLAKPSKYAHLPILGAKDGDWFPYLQAGWRNTVDFKGAMILAYRQFRQEACLVPYLMGGPFILLPASDLQWVVEQPDSVLNAYAKTIVEDLQTDLTIMDRDLIHKPVHQKLIVTTLTNQIGNLVPLLADETAHGFDVFWGTDTDSWKEVCVYDTVRYLIGSVTNRVFVGLPWCRNEALTTAAMAFAQDVPLTSTFLRALPRPLRPLIAPLLTLPNRIHSNRFIAIILPEVERRLRAYDAAVVDNDKANDDEQPNDFLQWSINQARQSEDPYLAQPRTLAGRILLLNFAAIHTSSFALTGVLLDLVCSDKGAEDIAELRDEIATVLAEQAGRWDKHALARMVKLDSCMRESARVNSFVTVGLGRLCMAPGGCVSPSGARIPPGASTQVPSYAIMHDPDLYEDADKFRPFRFASERVDPSVEYVQRARKQFATTGPDYLAFGHGRHACPGRFFAANELKLMLAHVVLHYDFEMQPVRPPNTWFGLNRIPAISHTIKVRKRKDPFAGLELQQQQ